MPEEKIVNHFDPEKDYRSVFDEKVLHLIEQLVNILDKEGIPFVFVAQLFQDESGVFLARFADVPEEASGFMHHIDMVADPERHHLAHMQGGPMGGIPVSPELAHRIMSMLQETEEGEV